MSLSEVDSTASPRSAADTATRSTSVLLEARVNAGRARISSARSPMPQPAASNALRRANEFANAPSVIVFHTLGMSPVLTTADGAITGENVGTLAFCRTSRAEHCAQAPLAYRTKHAAQSVATRRNSLSIRFPHESRSEREGSLGSWRRAGCEMAHIGENDFWLTCRLPSGCPNRHGDASACPLWPKADNSFRRRASDRRSSFQALKDRPPRQFLRR